MDTKDLRIIFIGAGNIAQSMAKGLLNCSYVKCEQILAYAPSDRNLKTFQNFGCHTTQNLHQIFFDSQSSDVHYLLFICVKPNIGKDFGFWSSLKDKVQPNQWDKIFIVSVMAGVSLQTIENYLSPSLKHNLARIMPNTAMAINAGTIGLYWKPWNLTQKLWSEKLPELLNKLGKCQQVDNEEQINSIIGVAGSGIAFIYTVIQAMCDGGVSVGLSRQMSRELVTQTVMGAAKMVTETGMNPIELRDHVCSPAGTTIAGVEMLEQGGINATIINAVKKSTERSRELSK